MNDDDEKAAHEAEMKWTQEAEKDGTVFDPSCAFGAGWKAGIDYVEKVLRTGWKRSRALNSELSQMVERQERRDHERK